MKLTQNLTSNNAPNSTTLIKKPLREQFTGLSQALRKMLLSVFKVPENTSDIALMDELDDLFEKNELLKEQQDLKRQLAALMVDEAIHNGVLQKDDKDLYTRLATSNFEITKEFIYNTHQNRIELDELMKLSGHQLYMSDKLERLKELNEDCFKLKLKELEAYDYRNPKPLNINSTKNADDKNREPENELEALMKLSADELYYLDGKMERLKELNFSHFKLMYKEVFNAEYA